MSYRRMLPLIVCVMLAIIGLVFRLYQVQVEEHEIWARESFNLTRTARTIPYLRGRILDRNGDPFVQDEEAYAVRFIYREFRRHHPLGQVAHARGALANESVSLQAAALELESWGMQLVETKAADVERFARGEATDVCGIAFPEVERGQDRRRARAAELRFYTRGLLQVTFRNWNAIKKRISKGDGGEKSWLELAADQEGLPTDLLRERVALRLSRSLQRLEQLAVQMEVSSLDGLLPVTAEESLWYLVEGLQTKRREVEFAIAKDLFVEAAGFEPGRLHPDTLVAMIDLSFVRDELGWGGLLTRDWAQSMRSSWLEDRRSFHVPRAVIRARLREDGGEDALDAYLGELAVLFARKPKTPRERREASREWQEIEQVAVFAELEDLFERVDLEGREIVPLTIFDQTWRAAHQRGMKPEALAAGVLPFEMAATVARNNPPEPYLDWRGDEHAPWQAPRSKQEALARLLWQLYPPERIDSSLTLVDPSVAGDEEELLAWVESLWEAQFQEQQQAFFAELRAAAEEREFSLPLQLSEERVKRALKKGDYFIRDRGSRPERIDESPDDTVVNTLTRYADEFQGFEVEARTRRLAMALDEDDLLVARELIGVVRESTLEEVLEQQGDRAVFSRILAKKNRSRAEQEQAKDLNRRLFRLDEVHGTSGVEGLMDNFLRGTNGFQVNEGLQQREEGTRSDLFTHKVDGTDVELTLSIDLQRAAQRTIEDPYLPGDEEVRDEYWFRNPVGAIVLASVEGEILAAASGPKQPHESSPVRDGERAYNYERTLRMPWFQPPGSIFKPFIAAYALSRCGLDEQQTYACSLRPDGDAGWNKVACHRTWGHGEVALDEAIRHSCNAYFAQVGELLESKERVRELAHMFGFNQPTGVREFGSGRGLVEVHRIPSLNDDRRFSTTDLNRAGNGLAVIEATPVQVARAVAGLATGKLPSMRLVRRIGDDLVPLEYEEVPLPEEALQVVREGMVGVINEGSATDKGLGAELLGFQVAGKTGSADYRPMTSGYLAQLRVPGGFKAPQMRKHTWFVGYFPAENPTQVIVVYCHDIGVTASRSAVHVAAQFLRSPEVQAYVRGALR